MFMIVNRSDVNSSVVRQSCRSMLGIGGCQVVEALLVSAMVAVFDNLADCVLKSVLLEVVL